jgi:outer membrane biosynthesis protein TonB
VAALLAVAAVAFFAGERIGRTRVSEVATKTILVPAPRIVDETPKEPPPEPKPVRTVVPHESKTVEPAPERIPPPAPAPEPKPEPKPAPAIAAADPPPPAPRLRGDLNGDGVLDIADARILQQMIEQGLPLPEYADANGDGVVDIADVLAIMRAELALR